MDHLILAHLDGSTAHATITIAQAAVLFIVTVGGTIAAMLGIRRK